MKIFFQIDYKIFKRKCMFDFKIETRFLYGPTISKLNVNLIMKHAYQNEDVISKSQLDSKIELQF